MSGLPQVNIQIYAKKMRVATGKYSDIRNENEGTPSWVHFSFVKDEVRLTA